MIPSIRKEHKQFSPLWYLSDAPLLTALFKPGLFLVENSVLIGDLRQRLLPLILSKVQETVIHSLAKDTPYYIFVIFFINESLQLTQVRVEWNVNKRCIFTSCNMCILNGVFSKIINSFSSLFIKFIMFLYKFPENMIRKDDRFKITLLSLLINSKYDNASRHLSQLWNLSETYEI